MKAEATEADSNENADMDVAVDFAHVDGAGELVGTCSIIREIW
ncbi:hypothetical protein BRCON_1145 [Candidatus Sumerlaea chitinivorans]|uniref:Uncharacterized protein n=1 Tax=Sumerlaea chitinivorans TaxID=2250252 RepID=A0A2Z4Y5D4_SUMC1|nr:hypothetical protein BRCON_1145 [Candidatus Sumerlaea chitinivorans]